MSTLPRTPDDVEAQAEGLELGGPARRAGADAGAGGSSPRVRPSRATTTSRGSSRGGTAASAMPSAGAVGRSLSEWTATSTSPRSSASRSALTNTPVPPRVASGGGVDVALGGDRHELDFTPQPLPNQIGDVARLGGREGGRAGAEAQGGRGAVTTVPSRRCRRPG